MDNQENLIYLEQEKLKRKLEFCRRKYLPFISFDDLYQEYSLYILEGKSQKQTIDQFCIDFYRRLKRHFLGDEIDENDFYVNVNYEKLHDTVLKLKGLSGYSRIVVYLICVYGISLKEIGMILDISEGRVSQLISEIIKEINAKNI